MGCFPARCPTPADWAVHLGAMFLITTECGPLQANCYLLAPEEGTECVIIDPGMDAFDPVKSLVNKHGLTPVAVLATHGHFDHIWDSSLVADHYGIPVWIRSEDRHLLTDPASGVSRDLGAWLTAMPGWPLKEAEQIEILDDVDTLDLAGLSLGVIHAPGHTPGSVLYTLGTQLAFTGDVLFAGSIGRTDMPGGNSRTMSTTLRGPVMSLPDSDRILSGHGPSSTMRVERMTNPYLVASFLG